MILPATTSNGSEGNRVKLDVIELVGLIHGVEEASDFIHREGHALFSGNFDHALKRRLRISRQQGEQLFLGVHGHLCPQSLELLQRCHQNS